MRLAISNTTDYNVLQLAERIYTLLEFSTESSIIMPPHFRICVAAAAFTHSTSDSCYFDQNWPKSKLSFAAKTWSEMDTRMKYNMECVCFLVSVD